MTDLEILTQSIEKAIAGGWEAGNGTLAVLGAEGMARLVMGEGVSKLIFDQQFAKALWGEEITDWVSHYLDDKSNPEPPAIPLQTWAYHLQQMVIAEAPIKYLGENLPE